MEKIISSYSMNKSELKKLTKSQLIKLLLKQEKKKPEIIIVDDVKPVPAPRTTNQLNQSHYLERV